MSDNDKHLDVKSGYVPVSHTSRPIITSNPVAHDDPMIVTSEEHHASRVKLTEHGQSKLQPLTDQSALMPESSGAKTSETTDSDGVADVDTNGNLQQPSISTETNDLVEQLIADKTYKLSFSPSPAKKIGSVLIIIGAVLAIAAIMVMFVLSSR